MMAVAAAKQNHKTEVNKKWDKPRSYWCNVEYHSYALNTGQFYVNVKPCFANMF